MPIPVTLIVTGDVMDQYWKCVTYGFNMISYGLCFTITVAGWHWFLLSPLLISSSFNLLVLLIFMFTSYIISPEAGNESMWPSTYMFCHNPLERATHSCLYQNALSSCYTHSNQEKTYLAQPEPWMEGLYCLSIECMNFIHSDNMNLKGKHWSKLKGPQCESFTLSSSIFSGSFHTLLPVSYMPFSQPLLFL